MGFTDSQFFEAIEKNGDVKFCFNKIREACKELKNKTNDVWYIYFFIFYRIVNNDLYL